MGREHLAGFDCAIADAELTLQAQRLLDVFAFEGEQVWRYQPEQPVACFRHRERPTALFAGMDMIAIHALETLRELNLRVPRDVAVAGFDNLEFSAFTQPPLTTIQ